MAKENVTCNAICPDLLIVDRLEKLTGAIATMDQIELAETGARLPYEGNHVDFRRELTRD